MADLVTKLGNRIRQIRKDHGLSLEQLGELAGLHPNYIGQVERGEKNVTVESLEKIARGLGVSLQELFQYVDPSVQPDELGELIDLLAVRPSSDRALVLKLVKSVFEWEANKHS